MTAAAVARDKAAMIRKLLANGVPFNDPDFRVRGHQGSRLENVSDAIFGFALTLLVVTLEVPRTYDELVRTMRGFPAFALSFLVLVSLWHQHVTFFRRFGLSDRIIVTLNGALLFCVLFYVYPLKFMMAVVGDQFFGTAPSELGNHEMLNAMALMFGGMAAVLLLFGLLHGHAYRCRAALGLGDREAQMTRLLALHGLITAAIMATAIAAMELHPAGPGFLPLIVLPPSLWLQREKKRIRRETPPP